MTGVPRSALLGRFIQVRPELIAVCEGAAEAIIVSLVDYRTSPDHRSAFVDADGLSWWSATVPEVSASTGLTAHQARYALRKAVDRGLLITTEHHPRGDNYDRTKSYRVNYSNAQGANLPGAKSPTERGKSAPSGGANLPTLPIYEEGLIEVEEEPASGDAVAVAVTVDPFDEFWDSYPLRKGKKDAREAYSNALKKVPAEVILAGARAYASSLTPGTDPQKVKWAQGWLNSERWEDEYTPLTPAQQQGRPLSNVEQNLARFAAKHGGAAIGAN